MTFALCALCALLYVLELCLWLNSTLQMLLLRFLSLSPWAVSAVALVIMLKQVQMFHTTDVTFD